MKCAMFMSTVPAPSSGLSSHCGKMFGDMLAACSSSDTFDKHRIVMDPNLFEHTVKIMLDWNGSPFTRLVFSVGSAFGRLLQSARFAFPSLNRGFCAHFAFSKERVCIASSASKESKFCSYFSCFKCALKAAQSSPFVPYWKKGVRTSSELALFCFFRSAHARSDERSGLVAHCEWSKRVDAVK